MSSVTAPLSVVRTWSAARLAAVALTGLVAVSTVVRAWAASKHAGPAYFPDEYLYTELSRSIASSGHAYVRGAPSHFAPLLAPLLTAPAWLFGSVSAGYRAAQTINAFATSLAAVPVFVLARTLRLGRPQALAAAAFSLLLPGLLYASFILSEPIAYPLVLAAVAVGVRALERPNARRIAAFVGFVVLASFARLQFAVLLPCFLVALVGVFAREQRVRTTLRTHWRAAVGLLVATGVLAAVGPARSTGYYPSFLHVGIHPGNIVSALGLNALILVVGCGLVLVPGAILGAVAAIERPRMRAELAFALLTATVTVALLLQASIYGDTNVAQSRYTFYLVPLWTLSFLLYAQRGWQRRRFFALLGLGLITAVLTTPLTTAAYGHGKVHSPELFAVARIEQFFKGEAGRASSAILFAVLALVAVTLAVAWVRPRLAATVALVGAAGFMLTISVAAYAFDSTNTRSVRELFSGSSPSWVDDLHVGKTRMLLTPNGLMTDALEQMFWNRSVDRVVLLPGAKPTDSLPAGVGAVAGDGTLLADKHPVTGPVLVDEYASSVQVRNAARLGSGPTSVLYRPANALQLRLVAVGHFHDDWLADHGELIVWPDAKGGRVAGRVVFHVNVPPAAGRMQFQFRSKSETRAFNANSGGEQTFGVPVCGRGPVVLLFHVTPAGHLGDGRVVSARAKAPQFVPDAHACAVRASS